MKDETKDYHAMAWDHALYEGLWDSMDDVWDELTVSCFNKLKTPAAKAELQRRWMEHKGLAA